jgi:hypothetical protein
MFTKRNDVAKRKTRAAAAAASPDAKVSMKSGSASQPASVTGEEDVAVVAAAAKAKAIARKRARIAADLGVPESIILTPAERKTARDAQSATATVTHKETAKMPTKAETAAKAKALGLEVKSGKAKAAKASKAGDKAPRKQPDSRARFPWREAAEAAAAGKMPGTLDFSANTHRHYRPLLAEVEKLAKARDLKGLQAYKITATCTSPAAVNRWRDLCVTALKAKKSA